MSQDRTVQTVGDVIKDHLFMVFTAGAILVIILLRLWSG